MKATTENHNKILNPPKVVKEEYPRCPTCGTGIARAPHPCPYNEEMGGFNKMCTCCEECTIACARDI